MRTADSTPPEPRDVSDWFYVPEWRVADPAAEPHRPLADAPVLVMDEGAGLGAAVADRLQEAGARPYVVRRGLRSERNADDEFVVDPDDPDSYERMAAEVCASGRLAGVVDCWAAEAPDSTGLDTGGYALFLGALQLGHALGPRTTVRPLPIVLAARGTDRLLPEDVVDPARAFSVGAARVLPQEHPGFRLTHVDVDDAFDGSGSPARRAHHDRSRTRCRASERRTIRPRLSTIADCRDR